MISNATSTIGPFFSNIDWQRYQLISIDIFDTLLHRAVSTPIALFIELGRQARKLGLIDACISAEEFQAVRIEMERRARQLHGRNHCSQEVGIDEIWRQAPTEWPAEKLMTLELDIEYALSFPNPYTLALTEFLAEIGIPFCFTSDTYFPRPFLLRLLTKAGLRHVDALQLLLSNEHDANKSTGSLFVKLLAVFPHLKATDILHVGDDPVADGIQAKRYGIASCYLDTLHLPAQISRRMVLLGNDKQLNPLTTLERLGHFAAPNDGNNDQFFRYLGTSLIGPSLAAFCLWVVKDALARNISLICPIMREGALFAPLLRSAITLLGADIAVQPFYISRRAAFLAAMEELNEDTIAHYGSRRHFTLANLISELSLPEPEGPLQEQKHLELADLLGQTALRDYLHSNAVKMQARSISAETRALLKEYQRQTFGQHQQIAMLDLGPGGNSLAWMADSLEADKSRIHINYLFYALPELSKNRLRGHRYASFLMPTTEQLPLLRLINRSPEPLETLLTGLGQTTLGYRRNPSGKVEPLLDNSYRSAEQQALLTEFASGLELAAWHLSHAARYVDSEWLVSEPSRVGTLRQLYRLLEMPTPREAFQLGSLKFDDNAGSDSYQPICSDQDRRLLTSLGTESFMRVARHHWGYQTHRVRWPQGVVCQCQSDFILDQHRNLYNDTEHNLLCANLIDQLRSSGHHRATIYGAGKLGYEMLNEAQLNGVDIDYIVDSNGGIHGLTIRGKTIVPLSQAAAEGCGIYLVASAAFSRQIYQTIRDFYVDHRLDIPTIFSIDKGHP